MNETGQKLIGESGVAPITVENVSERVDLTK